MKILKALLLNLVLVILNLFIASAQQIDSKEIDKITREYVKSSFGEFREYLSIPNDAHYVEHVKNNINWLERTFSEIGFSTSVLETAFNPLFFAERIIDENYKTVLFYLHGDGQPVDVDKWDQEDPYKPVLKERNKKGTWGKIDWNKLEGDINEEWRIFARSSSDDKGPIEMLISALKILKQKNINSVFNLKVIIDLEEEISSPGLPFAVEKYKEVLQSDMLLIFDGPKHYTNKPSLTFGARGICSVDLTVFGPKFHLHSGHFGNYAPNPAFLLSGLLSSMKDEDGKVIIPGYYDGINLDKKTLEILANVPDDEDQIKQNLGIAGIDNVGNNYQEALQYPSLNIRGMSSGWVGKEARTIVPAFATAAIDIRFVPESDPEKLVQLVKDHIIQKGYYLVEGEPNDEERKIYSRLASFKYKISYHAYRTPMDSEIGIWLDKAIVRTFGEEPVKKRISGGSVPISPFINALNVPAVTVPTVNQDNNQHSPNENLRIGNYIDGIKTFLGILTQDI